MSHRILIYDDSPVFGGHEVMTLLAVEAMLRATKWELHFVAAEANERLQTRLQELAAKFSRLTIATAPHAFHRLQGVLNHIHGDRISRLAGMFRSIDPTIALIIQGDIEISSAGLLASGKAQIPSVSYIPLPHNQVEKGGKYGAARDLFAKGLYKVPNAYITISTVLADMLRDKGVSAPIKVVYNGIETENFTAIDKRQARADLEFSPSPSPSAEESKIVGLVGRLERKQKQQHQLIQALAESRSDQAGMHAAFCGDGPDADYFRDLSRSLGVEDRTHFMAWRSDLATFYSAIDVLAIPSRYEGVPLVMLEALCCGTPVVAGARDGMKELLPTEWLFEPGDTAAIRSTIDRIFADPSGTDEHVQRLQKTIRKDMTVDAFGKSFTAAVEEFCTELNLST